MIFKVGTVVQVTKTDAWFKKGDYVKIIEDESTTVYLVDISPKDHNGQTKWYISKDAVRITIKEILKKL